MEQAEKAYVKHVLLVEMKKIFKELYGKGADKVEIKISGNFIFLQFSGYLKNSELAIIGEKDKAQLIWGYRRAISLGSRKGIIERLEAVLGRNICNYVTEYDIPTNTAVCLIILE